MTEKIIARFIIEIAGKPVENVQKALDTVLKKIEDEKKFKLIESHVGEPELDKETTLYGGFLDVEIKFSAVKDILGFILDYTPTSVEVVDPEKIDMKLNDLNDLLNNVSLKLLGAHNMIRRLNAQIHYLKKEQK